LQFPALRSYSIGFAIAAANQLAFVSVVAQAKINFIKINFIKINS